MAEKELRPIRIEGNVAYIPLTKGYEALIDAEDVPLVEGWNWFSVVRNYTVYAARATKRQGKPVTIMLHRAILGASGRARVDHLSGNGLDNRRVNLRPATASENGWNRGRNSNNSSGFKGVWWAKHVGKWQALITAGGRREYLGLFDSPEAAHAAYSEAAKRLHGEFAKLG
jgi:hypothetical protein